MGHSVFIRHRVSTATMVTRKHQNVTFYAHCLSCYINLIHYHLKSQRISVNNINHTRCADKSLARPGRKQALKHVRNARDCNNIETRTVIKYFFLQGKAPKKIHVILTETLACFLPGQAKDFSAPLYEYYNATLIARIFK